MSDVILDAADGPTIPVHAMTEAQTGPALESIPAGAKAFAAISDFKGKAGQLLLVPGADGALAHVLFGLGALGGAGGEPMVFRTLAGKLPAGTYRIARVPEGMSIDQIALAFALGSYRFDRYKAHGGERAKLVAEGADAGEVRQVAHACALARDMINTPANDMGPLQIETIAREIAELHGATIAVVTGDALLEANYPAVHAVGRAADPARSPRMIEIAWEGPEGKAGQDKPLVCLVGKGVVFDTGGLDIKPSAGMRQMKKDMGGAAHALALGRMIMAAKLPVRLVVLTPVVENAISGDAMRPGDVLASRKGLSIEVGNTDAEGRLILADAIVRAGEDSPDYLIETSTLTGAQQVALGLRTMGIMGSDAFRDRVAALARECGEDGWAMPLPEHMRAELDSRVADLANVTGARWGGMLVAGTFLREFVPDGLAWAHLDIAGPSFHTGSPYGYTVKGGTGVPVRTIFAVLQDIAEHG
jgi:leucyl aminopeptidase